MTIFDTLKWVSVNHQTLNSRGVVITDRTGKPNGLLTDLITDLISNCNFFIDFKTVGSIDALIAEFTEHTPLPSDVLDEYHKILSENCVGINVAPQKDLVELIV